jgi:hypothetical protein
MPGFQYQQTYYSLLHREKTITAAMSAVAEIACRGIKLALVPLQASYSICVLEPNARAA